MSSTTTPPLTRVRCSLCGAPTRVDQLVPIDRPGPCETWLAHPRCKRRDAYKDRVLFGPDCAPVLLHCPCPFCKRFRAGYPADGREPVAGLADSGWAGRTDAPLPPGLPATGDDGCTCGPCRVVDTPIWGATGHIWDAEEASDA